MSTVINGRDLEKIINRIESIENKKILNAFAFLLGINQALSEENHYKHFYTYMQQIVARRGKEVGMTNITQSHT
ncbi:MAG: hypothetical protein AB8V23_00600 [Candidatus Midichloria sp.]|uniref:Uncharacterized protein n=1 Tax=Hyalomma marginatum TaxID=34627 RepID=A0A8S4BXF2_9ACAR|nr:hypothetical protein MHYMCMPSP_00240 [Hyalomma marginatum]CAG7599878.1 hypothetical protein MHYMCMPASI_01136 [Hyalomma marginatum]